MRDIKRNATVGEIAAALECTGVPITRAGVTEPRIDLAAARDYLLAPPVVNASYDFVDAADAAAWPAVTGAWNLQGGSYKADLSPGWKVASTANCNESLAIEARMRRVDAAENSPYNSGIFFKAQIDPVGRTVSGYFAAYNTFQGGQVFLSRLTGYNLLTQAGLPQILCVKEHQAAVQPNGTNALRVISRAGRHRVFMNGVLMCDVTDFAYGAGRVAVAAYFSPSNGRQAFTVNRIGIKSLASAAETTAVAQAQRPAAAADLSGGAHLAAGK
jgi:hypothetical protein